MIDRLEMFVALARERHFGRAAEASASPSPPSRPRSGRWRRASAWSSSSRGSRFIGLTPEGERALDWARRMVADARALRDEMRALARGPHRAPAARRHPDRARPRLAAHRRASPRATRACGSPSTSTTSIAILDGIDGLAFDAGVTYLDNEPLGRARAIPLDEERYALILRDDHPLAGARAARLGRGGRAAALPPDPRHAEPPHRRRATSPRPARRRPRASSRTPSPSSWRTSSPGGFATILPLGAAELFLAHGPLAAVPLTDPDARHDVGLVVPDRDPQLPVVEALIAEAGRFGG